MAVKNTYNDVLLSEVCVKIIPPEDFLMEIMPEFVVIKVEKSYVKNMKTGPLVVNFIQQKLKI